MGQPKVSEDECRTLLKHSDLVPIHPDEVVVVRDVGGEIVGYLVDREALR